MPLPEDHTVPAESEHELIGRPMVEDFDVSITLKGRRVELADFQKEADQVGFSSRLDADHGVGTLHIFGNPARFEGATGTRTQLDEMLDGLHKLMRHARKDD